MDKRSTQGADRLDADWRVLMVAAQAGDRTAYERLLRECAPLIRRTAQRLRVHGDAVEDVVQDVLLTIHRARQTYDPARSFSAWLVAIAQRRSIDALRRDGRKMRREVHDPIAYEGHPDLSQELAQGETTDMQASSVTSAINGLPDGQREAIEILALRQLTLDEAAALTGKTKGALKVNMHRALRTLRARFGGGEP